MKDSSDATVEYSMLLVNDDTWMEPTSISLGTVEKSMLPVNEDTWMGQTSTFVYE